MRYAYMKPSSVEALLSHAEGLVPHTEVLLLQKELFLYIGNCRNGVDEVV